MLKRLVLFMFLGICASLGGGVAVRLWPTLETRAAAQATGPESVPAPVTTSSL